MLRQRFLFQEKSLTVQIEELPNKTFVASKVCFCVLSQTWKFGQFVSLSLLQYWGIKWGLGWSSVLGRDKSSWVKKYQPVLVHIQL